MLKKLSNLNGVKEVSKKAQAVISGGRTAPVDEGFACYCNGNYVGEKTTIQECWDAC